MKPYGVIIVDDHPIFIQGVAIVIEGSPDFSVVARATNRAEALSLIASESPDLAVIDLNLGNEDGLELIKEIRERFPRLRVLVLSMMDERYYAERSLAAGARGYVMKEESSATLIRAMTVVAGGGVWLSGQEQSRVLESRYGTDGRNALESLSDRQLQILQLLGKGFGTIDIAEKLSISRKTVEAHKDQLKKKLACQSVQELIQLAIEWAARAVR